MTRKTPSSGNVPDAATRITHPVMCHSTCEKICFASGRGRIRSGVNPSASACFSASSSPSRPAAQGNSYIPASRPFAGRFVSANRSPSRITSTVFCSIRRAFAFAFTGNSVSRPAACAAHRSASGHSAQCGSPFGTQTSAPSSIRAWLKAPQASIPHSTPASAPSASRRNACFMMSVSSSVSLVRTRRTLPSTAGAGRPNAIEETAPAV